MKCTRLSEKSARRPLATTQYPSNHISIIVDFPASVAARLSVVAFERACAVYIKRRLVDPPTITVRTIVKCAIPSFATVSTLGAIVKVPRHITTFIVVAASNKAILVRSEFCAPIEIYVTPIALPGF